MCTHLYSPQLNGFVLEYTSMQTYKHLCTRSLHDPVDSTCQILASIHKYIYICVKGCVYICMYACWHVFIRITIVFIRILSQVLFFECVWAQYTHLLQDLAGVSKMQFGDHKWHLSHYKQSYSSSSSSSSSSPFIIIIIIMKPWKLTVQKWWYPNTFEVMEVSKVIIWMWNEVSHLQPCVASAIGWSMCSRLAHSNWGWLEYEDQ